MLSFISFSNYFFGDGEFDIIDFGCFSFVSCFLEFFIYSIGEVLCQIDKCLDKIFQLMWWKIVWSCIFSFDIC